MQPVKRYGEPTQLDRITPARSSGVPTECVGHHQDGDHYNRPTQPYEGPNRVDPICLDRSSRHQMGASGYGCVLISPRPRAATSSRPSSTSIASLILNIFFDAFSLKKADIYQALPAIGSSGVLIAAPRARSTASPAWRINSRRPPRSRMPRVTCSHMPITISAANSTSRTFRRSWAIASEMSALRFARTPRPNSVGDCEL